MILAEPDRGTPAPDRRERVAAPTTVRVTIDGQSVQVAEGTSVMRAASLGGVAIEAITVSRKDSIYLRELYRRALPDTSK